MEFWLICLHQLWLQKYFYYCIFLSLDCAFKASKKISCKSSWPDFEKRRGQVMTVRKNDPSSFRLVCVCFSAVVLQVETDCSVKTPGSRAVKAPLSCPLPLMTSYESLSCVFAGAERSQLFSGLWDKCGGWRASHNRVCLHWEAPLCVYACVVTNTGTEQDGKCEAQKCMLYECVSVCQCASSCVMLRIHVHCIFDVSICQPWNGRRFLKVTSCRCQLE